VNRLLFVAFLFLSFGVAAQPYGNEWIDYSSNRTYLKFYAGEDGVYRIDYATLNFELQAAGTSIAAVDPRSIQIFAKGEEQYLYINGEGDGSFDPGDYIEFYAEANDGWLDEQLYPSPEQHTNPYYSLYSDSLAYFLTWNPDNSQSSFRMEEVPYNNPTSSNISFLWYEELYVFTNTYQQGEELGAGKAYARYTGGKGWMSSQVGYNGSSTSHNLQRARQFPQAYTSGGAPDARLEVAVAGVNRGAFNSQGPDHHLQVRITPGGGSAQVLSDLEYESYDYVREEVSFSTSEMTGNFSFGVHVSSAVSTLSTTSDYSAAAYFKLNYPHTLNMEAATSRRFRVPTTSITRHFNASNFSTSNTTFLYDLEDHKRYEVDHSSVNGSVRTNIQAGAERWMYLCTEQEVNDISTNDISPVNGSGSFTDPMTWYADSAYLMISHPNLWSQAQSYRNHRAATHNVSLINVQELYDQFAYGILRHPLSIRGFCDYAIDQWNTPPQFLFLLGKAIGESEFRRDQNAYSQVLVPTMGYPPTDNNFTEALLGNPGEPALATGRLAASTTQQVSDYLAKVKEMELAQAPTPASYSIPNRAWQKRILHFAGGNDANENRSFSDYLYSYQLAVENPNYGGRVALFSKTNSDVIQQLNTDTLRELLKDGAAVMTFFGHASNNSFDLSVDDPSLWENRGRYPFVIANSCYTGNIHRVVSSVGSVSEEYVLTPREGAIAFIATPDLSFEGDLDRYTRELYFQFSEALYGRSIGEQMKQTARNVYSSTDKELETVALEMTLHGDPAMKIYPHALSELVANDYTLGPQITFEPEVITTELDSFSLLVNLTNLGRATPDSFSVAIERTLPNGEVLRTGAVVEGIAFEKTVLFRFPVDAENGIGTNQFRVEVDFPNGVIDEFDPVNNNIINNVETEIFSSEVFPVYPYDFSVVPSLDVTLKANTGSPFLPAVDYTFQIDTNDRYDSPFMQSHDMNQQGAILEWDPSLGDFGFSDSTVFFWRVSRKDSNEWREFSFQYIPDQRGWGQDHFFQFKDNAFDFLEADSLKRQLKLGEGARELTVSVIGNSSVTNVLERDRNEYRLDGKLAPFGEYSIAYAGPGMAIAVIDSLDLMPWGTYGYNSRTGLLENEDHQFGNNNSGVSNHRSRVEYFFTYATDREGQMNSMINLITNEVEDGHYILAYTQIHAAFEDSPYWTNDRFAAFEALGADSIRFVENNHPYIFLVKKGSPETAVEVVGHDPREVLFLRETLTTTIFSGEMESQSIGPAREWEKLIWTHQSIEQPSTDIDSVGVFGIANDGIESHLMTVQTTGETDLSGVNAQQYPMLKLKYVTTDEANRTSGQLRNWHVLFQPVPEAALNPLMGYVEPETEVNSGTELSFGISLDNISDFDFDTMAVDYWIQDSRGEIVESRTEWLSGPRARTTNLDTINFSSRGLSGNYSFWMRANPMDGRWQREQYDFNNTAFRSFSVTADNTNPLLDVTFDGIHILDGDIVAPQPEVVIELNDENELLLINDTSYLEVFLTLPSGEERRIPFFGAGREVMFFEPATDSKNRARITYQPDAKLADGTYKLRVSGTDVTGNAAGKTDYSIRFEVINQSMITQVMNYPNPFTTSTRFVFTLTGAQVPDVFTIQILTVTGKVVREITRDELGPIRIGRNMTEYAWDGRDEYGDRLGNGVYLYRVITKINGESIENMQTNADNYFKEGFGKMYLFR